MPKPRKTSHQKGIGVDFSVSGEEKTSTSGEFNVPALSDFMSLDEDENTSAFWQDPSASSNSLPLKKIIESKFTFRKQQTCQIKCQFRTSKIQSKSHVTLLVLSHWYIFIISFRDLDKQ